MEKKINVVEILKDCPSGMELDCTMYEDVFFDYVDELNIIHCYIQHETHKTSITFNQHGTPNSDIKSKCVIFPKGKTTWEGFQRPFKNGDIIFKGNYVTIVSHIESNGRIWYHCWYNTKYKDCKFKNDFGIGDINDGNKVRFATEEEKEILFQSIKDNGYCWNEETKTLEKLPKFKDGDIVSSGADLISIFKGIKDGMSGSLHSYVSLQNSWNLVIDSSCWTLKNIRLATEYEKQKLFQAIENNGYKWNSETKTLEKLVTIFKVGDKIKLKNVYAEKFNDFNTRKITEIKHSHFILDDEKAMSLSNQYLYELVPNKFNITTLVPFESRVLVRDTDHYEWEGAVFGRYDGNTFFTIGGVDWKYCIPYEGNEHLFGTINDCDDFYKTWEK